MHEVVQSNECEAMTAAIRLCACGQPTYTPRHSRCELHAFTHGRPDAVVDPSARYADDPAALVPRLALVGITAADIGEIMANRRGSLETGGAPIAEVTSARNEGRNERVRRKRAAGEWSNAHGYRPVERLPDGAWSEHGQRVEAALVAAEVAVARAELASLRGRGAES